MIDADAAEALRAILSNPAVPVGSTVAGRSDGSGAAALREAHDYVVSRRIAAGVDETPQAAARLGADLGRINGKLARSLRWHAALAALLSALPAGRARNAALGDVRRGDLLTWAPEVRSWTWAPASGNPVYSADSIPHSDNPLARATGELVVDDDASLYDAILLWEREAAAIVVVPTHRAGVTWAPVGDGRWEVHLARVSVHVDELIVMGHPPDLDGWPHPS